jgi:hypothetical protein
MRRITESLVGVACVRPTAVSFVTPNLEVDLMINLAPLVN